MNLTVIILLLAGLIVSAVICAILSDLLKAAIALAFTSAILSVIMFVLGAPLAAVFELSVCAGLITVVFISACSMNRNRTKEEQAKQQRERNKRFIMLPAILFALTAVLAMVLRPYINDASPVLGATSSASVQTALWSERQVDLLGQIVIILTGVYGVIVFFKEAEIK